MNTSKSILIAGSVMIGLGFIYNVVKSRPVTPVFAGGVGFILLASLLEMIPGEYAGRIAVGIAGVATFTTLLVEGPSILQAVTNLSTGKDLGVISSGASGPGGSIQDSGNGIVGGGSSLSPNPSDSTITGVTGHATGHGPVPIG